MAEKTSKNNNNQNYNEQKKVMFKGKNLVSEFATQPNKYITTIMRILFSTDELSNGSIIEDIEKSTSKRVPLDLDRVQLLKSKNILKTFKFIYPISNFIILNEKKLILLNIKSMN